MSTTTCNDSTLLAGAKDAPRQPWYRTPDLLGLLISGACALHCLAAPVVLLLAPLAGGWWSHPAIHLGSAALAIPLALYSLGRGFRQHGRRWVPCAGGLGAGFIVLALALPSGGEAAGPAEAAGGAGECAKACCPQIEVSETTGEWSFRAPASSLVMMAGGILLVTAHGSNLRLRYGGRCPCPKC